MNFNEKRIREFAYQIWESEGQPEGQEARHWEMAHKLTQAEALATPSVKSLKPAAIEPAAKKLKAPLKPLQP